MIDDAQSLPLYRFFFTLPSSPFSARKRSKKELVIFENPIYDLTMYHDTLDECSLGPSYSISSTGKKSPCQYGYMPVFIVYVPIHNSNLFPRTILQQTQREFYTINCKLLVLTGCISKQKGIYDGICNRTVGSGISEKSLIRSL